MHGVWDNIPAILETQLAKKMEHNMEKSLYCGLGFPNIRDL